MKDRERKPIHNHEYRPEDPSDAAIKFLAVTTILALVGEIVVGGATIAGDLSYPWSFLLGIGFPAIEAGVFFGAGEVVRRSSRRRRGKR